MKIKSSLLHLAAIFALVLSPILVAQTTPITANALAEVSNQGNFPAVLQPALHNYWSNGYLIATAPRLRHYSFEKGQLEALLDPGSLPDAQTSREMWRSIQGRYVGAINLQCNSKTLAFYNAASGDLFEYDLKTSILNLTKIASLPDVKVFQITGFALTNSGDIFASFYDRSNVKAVVAGLFQLVRDSSGGAKWVAVPGTTGRYRETPPIQKLWGADGESLVFSRSKDGRLYWTK